MGGSVEKRFLEIKVSYRQSDLNISDNFLYEYSVITNGVGSIYLILILAFYSQKYLVFWSIQYTPYRTVPYICCLLCLIIEKCENRDDEKYRLVPHSVASFLSLTDIFGWVGKVSTTYLIFVSTIIMLHF